MESGYSGSEVHSGQRNDAATGKEPWWWRNVDATSVVFVIIGFTVLVGNKRDDQRWASGSWDRGQDMGACREDRGCKTAE